MVIQDQLPVNITCITNIKQLLAAPRNCYMLIPSYDNVLNELDARNEAWDEAERRALKEDEAKQDHDEEVDMGEVKTNPYKTLIGQLLGYTSYRSSASTRGSMI